MWARLRRWFDWGAFGVTVATGAAIVIEALRRWDQVPMLIFAVPFFVGAMGIRQDSKSVKVLLALIYGFMGQVIRTNNARAVEPSLLMAVAWRVYWVIAAGLLVLPPRIRHDGWKGGWRKRRGVEGRLEAGGKTDDAQGDTAV
jgi:hypothetical protein